jgi:integrase
MGANRKRLTESNVFNLPTKRRQYRVWDEGANATRGLFVLVQPTGTRTYHVMFRFEGSREAHTLGLGRVGEITLAKARSDALQARQRVAAGEDPQAGDPKRTLSFEAMFRQFTEDQRAENYSSAGATEKFVLSSCKAWRHRPVGTITYPEIKAVLNAKRETAPHAANRLHRSLTRFFKWLVGNDVLKASVMYGRSLPSKAKAQEERQFDWLTYEKGDAAIKAIWSAADAIGNDAGRHLKLCLILGKRRGAVERIRWEQINADWYWQAPQPRKGTTKRLHAIPLPKLAQRVLGKHGGAGRVFSSTLYPPVVMRQVREHTGLQDFIYHALRHLAETKCAELGIPPHIRDMLFDHSPGKRRGAGKGYDKHDYLPERLAALETWCAHILNLVSPAEGVAVLR